MTRRYMVIAIDAEWDVSERVVADVKLHIANACMPAAVIQPNGTGYSRFRRGDGYATTISVSFEESALRDAGLEP